MVGHLVATVGRVTNSPLAVCVRTQSSTVKAEGTDVLTETSDWIPGYPLNDICMGYIQRSRGQILTDCNSLSDTGTLGRNDKMGLVWICSETARELYDYRVAISKHQKLFDSWRTSPGKCEPFSREKMDRYQRQLP